MRTLIALAAAAALLPPVAAAATGAGRIDLSTPEGALLASRKTACSLQDGVPVTYWWHGEMYSRVPERRKLS